jgi:hypothetical protein
MLKAIGVVTAIGGSLLLSASISEGRLPLRRTLTNRLPSLPPSLSVLRGADSTPGDSLKILFAVYPTLDGNSAYLDPIAFLRDGQLAELPHDDNLSSEFRKTYYDWGRSYRLLLDGRPVGSATAVPDNMLPCVRLQGDARLSTSVPLRRGTVFLATDANLNETLRVTSRATVRTEDSTLATLARGVYRQNGQTTRPTLTAGTVIETPSEGRPLLAGSFTLDRTARHALFLLAQPTPRGYEPGIVWYDTEPHPGPSGEFWLSMTFFAFIDLDGDGQPEVVTQRIFFEGGDFVIYRRLGSSWRQIYAGGTNGC